MAKVELKSLVELIEIWPRGIESGRPIDGFPQWFNEDIKDEYNEYANKVWQEGQVFTLINELVDKRKVLQRKLDAARKRFKRLTKKLNLIEDSWVENPL